MLSKEWLVHSALLEHVERMLFGAKILATLSLLLAWPSHIRLQ